MKKIYIAAIGLLSIGLFASCQDWLEMPSESKLNSETIFNDYTRAEKVLLGCYPQTYNAELFYQFGASTDECISAEGSTNSKNQVSNYVYTTANSPTSTYNAMYKGIEYANVVIDNIDDVPASNDTERKKLDMLKGEALAIRATNYLNLVRYFGDVPHPTKSTLNETSFLSSRVSRDTILDACVKDLQTAISLLPWQSEQAGLGVTGRERYSKNAAYGMLARVALYAAGYSLRWDLNTYDASTVKMAQRSDASRIKELYKIAADACKAVIDKEGTENSLLPKFETVFRDLCTGQYNSETMLEFGQEGLNVNGLRNGYTNGIYCHSNSLYKKVQPAQAACPVFYFDYKDGDSRRDVTICNYLISSKNKRHMAMYSNQANGKFRATWTTDLETGKVNMRSINFPLLRYSDVLLMYAEALNEYNNGPTAEAIQSLKKVRLRAYETTDESKIGTIPTDYEGFRKAIIEERKLELAFEGWRRTDLVRWNILGSELMKTKKRIFELAKHEGEFANVPLYRIYKETTATEFQDPVVAVSFTGVNEKLSQTDSLNYVKQGYVVLPTLLSDPNGMWNSKAFMAGDGKFNTWVLELYRGLLGETADVKLEGENQVELLPLNTQTITNNPGLKGQQHPKY